jgi:ribosomal protein L37E
MANCPNCGRSTLRTQDWACQWCGYPLISGSFKQMPMTYQEAKAERLHSCVTAETVVELESQVAGAVEEMEETREQVAEAVEEAEETAEPVAEVAEEAEETRELVTEAAEEAEETRELVIEAAEEVEETGESVAEAAEEAEETREPVTEAVEEMEEPREPVTEAVEEMEEPREPVAEVAEEAEETSESEVVPITIEELNRICKEDSEAAEARFANTVLQVIGVVVRIPPMESIENPCLILTNTEKSVARNLLCVFDKQYEAAINKLSVGQMVTVQGKYDGCVINILLNDCVLVD